MRWISSVAVIAICVGCADKTQTVENEAQTPTHVQHIEHERSPTETLDSLELTVREPDGTPFLTLDKEPTSRLVNPYALDSVLPVAVVHREMIDRQIDSLVGAGPHIVRFEVIDLNPKVPPSLYDEKTVHGGSTATVLVYYGARTDDSIPTSSIGVELYSESGTWRGKSLSPKLHAIHVEVLEFDLQPIGSSRQVRDGTTRLVFGKDGWKIVAERKGKSADASYLLDRIPVNDPSALAMFRSSGRK